MEFPLRTMLLLSLGPLLARETVTEKDIKVYETADLEVVEGDSATIHCCWRAINHPEWKVDWSKNEVQPLYKATAVRYDGEGCGSALSPVNNGTCGCATLTLPNVTRSHTGRFVCRVTKELPILQQVTGHGTMITVTEPTQNAPLPLPVVVSLTIVMAAAFLIALICLWKLQRRRELDRVARVLCEVPHGDSAVDGTSTSSSKGSYQWCQVAVYESFDYFERVVESKGSG